MDSGSTAARRKRPRQERSRATVDAILEAAVLLLVDAGYDALTTTKVAERAGVSVGSLYQYFPSKDSLVNALIERSFARSSVILGEAVVASKKLPLAERVRVILAGLLRAKADAPELTAVLNDQMARVNGVDYKVAMIRASVAVIRGMLDGHDEVDLADPERSAWVIAHAIEGLLTGAIRDRMDFGAPQLLDEMCALIYGYLGIRPR